VRTVRNNDESRNITVLSNIPSYIGEIRGFELGYSPLFTVISLIFLTETPMKHRLIP